MKIVYIILALAMLTHCMPQQRKNHSQTKDVVYNSKFLIVPEKNWMQGGVFSWLKIKPIDVIKVLRCSDPIQGESDTQSIATCKASGVEVNRITIAEFNKKFEKALVKVRQDVKNRFSEKLNQSQSALKDVQSTINQLESNPNSAIGDLSESTDALERQITEIRNVMIPTMEGEISKAEEEFNLLDTIEKVRSGLLSDEVLSAELKEKVKNAPASERNKKKMEMLKIFLELTRADVEKESTKLANLLEQLQTMKVKIDSGTSDSNGISAELQTLKSQANELSKTVTLVRESMADAEKIEVTRIEEEWNAHKKLHEMAISSQIIDADVDKFKNEFGVYYLSVLAALGI